MDSTNKYNFPEGEGANWTPGGYSDLIDGVVHVFDGAGKLVAIMSIETWKKFSEMDNVERKPDDD